MTSAGNVEPTHYVGKPGKRAWPHNLGAVHTFPGLTDQPALIDYRDEHSPREFSVISLHRQVCLAASALQKLDIRPGDRVGFLAENRWELLVGYLATMYCGAVAVPINYKLPPPTIAHILIDANVKLVFADAERMPLLPERPSSALRTFLIDDDTHQVFVDFATVAIDDRDPWLPEAGDLAQILYTSGSTGLPKGVPLTHSGQLWALSQFPPPDTNQEHDHALVVAPLYHMNALIFSAISLLHGTTIVLMPRFDAARVMAAVARYRCSTVSGVTSMFAMIAALSKEELPRDLSFVKKVSVGSAPLDMALLARITALFPNAQISNGYGSTEAGPATFGPHPQGLSTPPLALGYPLSEIEWRLEGPEANTGTLLLKTPALTPGYLNLPDVTAKKMRDGWYDTGDVMRRDESGFFYFVSRADDMFVCGGENVFPGEVEAVIQTHEQVRECIVVGVPHEIKGTVPVAFVIPVAGQHIDESDIKTFYIARAPAYSHPRKVIEVSEFPMGGTHKVDRRKLQSAAESIYGENPR